MSLALGLLAHFDQQGMYLSCTLQSLKDIQQCQVTFVRSLLRVYCLDSFFLSNFWSFFCDAIFWGVMQTVQCYLNNQSSQSRWKVNDWQMTHAITNFQGRPVTSWYLFSSFLGAYEDISHLSLLYKLYRTI